MSASVSAASGRVPPSMRWTKSSTLPLALPAEAVESLEVEIDAAARLAIVMERAANVEPATRARRLEVVASEHRGHARARFERGIVNPLLCHLGSSIRLSTTSICTNRNLSTDKQNVRRLGYTEGDDDSCSPGELVSPSQPLVPHRFDHPHRIPVNAASMGIPAALLGHDRTPHARP